MKTAWGLDNLIYIYIILYLYIIFKLDSFIKDVNLLCTCWSYSLFYYDIYLFIYFYFLISTDQFLMTLKLYNCVGGPAVQTSAFSRHSVPTPASRCGCQQIHASEAYRESGTHQKPTRACAALECGGGRPGCSRHGLLLHLRCAGAQRRNVFQMENHGRDQSHASAHGLQGVCRTLWRQNTLLYHHREGRVRPLRTLQRHLHRVGQRHMNSTHFYKYLF